ncbi:MAG: hypothetical protein L6R19_01305 [Alphaproteobacteria bacterium]|nr:hypothetical protein [Alphaproteobacteria bacterium]
MASRAPLTILLAGFVAGFLAVLLFHQPVGAAMHWLGWSRFAPFSMAPVPPLGVPRVLSLAFWGGVWGIVLAAVAAWLPRRPGAFLLAGFVFGIVGPAFFAWFVLAPLRGQAVAQGWQATALLRSAVINGMWGLGAALFLLLARRLRLAR